MTGSNSDKKNSVEQSAGCETNPSPDIHYDPIEPRTAAGKAPVLVEIVCERVHCVLYDFAISTVDMIAEKYGKKIEIQTVIRQGDKKNAQHYMDLCKQAGKMLAVPTILINGEVAFTSVPHPKELEAEIDKVLSQKY